MPIRASAQTPPRRRAIRPVGTVPSLPALLAMVSVLMLLAGLAAPAGATSRIKDIVNVEGVRDNMLVGYGLVVGLNGSGDSLTNSPFTEQSLMGMLERLGVNIRDSTQLKTKNVAAVMVTASLPPFTRQGGRIDVQVSSLGDARSLLGGSLLVTPLLGADGEVYAVAQGSLSIGGYAFQGAGQSVSQGVPTTGRIANGAIVEREIPFALTDLGRFRLSLRNPDFTTARRITDAINRYAGAAIARATDPSTVQVTVPAGRDVVGLITDIEQLPVQPDQVARVVIDERTGIIVMGENVRISTVAVAQGNLTVRITETPQVSQPGPLSQDGQTVVVPRTQIDVSTGQERQLGILDQGVTLQELVQNLNALGIGPRDMISILQSIKAAGAMQADIEVM